MPPPSPHRRLGPLVLATFLGGRGFITYQNLDVDGRPADEDSVRQLVEQALAHYEAMPEISRVEWKTRGHDHAPGLHEALVAHGFAPDEPESVMIGEARLLAVDVDLPDGIVVRRVTDEDEVRAMLAMQAEVFGDDPDGGRGARRCRSCTGCAPATTWRCGWPSTTASIVSAGRLEPVDGTEFAGIWGGATRPEYRGRGIYRALTAARARSAIGLRQALHQQRLDRVLPADPGAVRLPQGLDDHPLRVAPHPLSRHNHTAHERAERFPARSGPGRGDGQRLRGCPLHHDTARGQVTLSPGA